MESARDEDPAQPSLNLKVDVRNEAGQILGTGTLVCTLLSTGGSG